MTFWKAKHEEKLPRNKRKLLGQKLPLKLSEIYAIRTRLELAERVRDLALFNLAIDSKLRGCDLVTLKVSDVSQSGKIRSRAMIIQQKTHNPVQFEITGRTRESLSAWITYSRRRSGDYLFPSRVAGSNHLSTRQYARIVKSWVEMIGLDPSCYGTHTMRRTKSTIIYRNTHNLRAIQILLGHKKLESTVRYLGVEVDDALELSENTDI